MDMEKTIEYEYQSLIDILAEMVTTYLTIHPIQRGGEANAEPYNESV